MPAKTAQDPNPVNLEDLYSIEDLAAAFPKILSPDTLRWQLRRRNENGLARCCFPVGRRILISKSRYEAWMASRAGLRAAA